MKLLIGLIFVSMYIPYIVADADADADASASTNGAGATATAVATANSDVTLPAPALDCGGCPAVYQPVCGTNGKTYSNECFLKCASKKNIQLGLPPIFVHKQGACGHKNCFCPQVVQPVCGSDGQTYSNECYLVCENKWRALIGLPPIHIVHKGVCKNTLCLCPKTILPVCGTDGRTYRNVCFLQCASQISQANGGFPIFLKSIGRCPKESCLCPLNLDPVCASDGKTYSNPCMLACENRVRDALGLKPLTIKYKGPCFSCFCNQIADPLCASDGNTYGNPCLLNCENKKRAASGLPPLKIQYKGACINCVCPKHYDPVCANDGKTYGNPCLLKCENAIRQKKGLKKLYIVHKGVC